jgi:hypothetical protein
MLARKSRKNIVEESIKSDLLKTAGYVRLSVNKTDDPSESIENQKKLIEGYAVSNPDLQLERSMLTIRLADNPLIDLRSTKCWRISGRAKSTVWSSRIYPAWGAA